MKNKIMKMCTALGLSLALMMGVLAGCGASSNGDSAAADTEGAAGAATDVSAETEAVSEEVSAEPAETARDAVTIRVGSLKGPTSMGILFLMDKAERGETTDNYEFTMAAAADELLPLMIKGDLDIALVPANVAAVLYSKTEGAVEVIDINTLGVLYVVTGSDEVTSIEDLKGKTIYLTGKGTTPEASLRYVLSANGFTESDYTLEFKSEATEVAAVLAEDPGVIGLLPQPFVTSAIMQNDALNVALDLNEEWKKVTPETPDGMVTGVTVVRKAFLEENTEAVDEFLQEHAESVSEINDDPATGATLAVNAGIVAKEAIAQKAIPECNISCILDVDMKANLAQYLGVLADFDSSLVGGSVPGDDFYYTK
jgi:NitT/TauT family transport system substrate-binding protein